MPGDAPESMAANVTAERIQADGAQEPFDQSLAPGPEDACTLTLRTQPADSPSSCLPCPAWHRLSPSLGCGAGGSGRVHHRCPTTPERKNQTVHADTGRNGGNHHQVAPVREGM
jgi:hypothetical protein